MALLHTAVALRPLYPVKKALSTGKHAVGGDGGVHKLYYEEHGKAAGAPALFLHGGPGAGCFQRHAGFFDPDHYRVLLFDQRGSGSSVPKGCLDGNETPQLIADIEELRVMLGIEAWQVVLGGSWGTTLALAYAQAHPSRVRSLVLRAVCLMRQREIRWLFGARGGAAQLHPAGWKSFSAAAPGRKGMAAAEVELEDEIEEEAALRAYAGAMRDGEAGAASAWGAWEGAISSMGARLQPCPTPALAASADGSPAPLTPEPSPADVAAAAAATATVANIAATTVAAAAAAPAAAAATAATADAGSWAWVPELREWRLCETTAAAPSEVRAPRTCTHAHAHAQMHTHTCTCTCTCTLSSTRARGCTRAASRAGAARRGLRRRRARHRLPAPRRRRAGGTDATAAAAAQPRRHRGLADRRRRRQEPPGSAGAGGEPPAKPTDPHWSGIVRAGTGAAHEPLLGALRLLLEDHIAHRNTRL